VSVETNWRLFASVGWGGKVASQCRGQTVRGQTVRGQTVSNLFRSPGAAVNNALIGVSRDSAGAALAGCTVELYHGKKMIAGTTSDGSGNYRFDNPGSGPFRVIFDKTGMAGLTSENLIAV
jgi:Carboxypeptidase regulatory-like domain